MDDMVARGSMEVAEALAIIGGIMIPASCVMTEAWTDHATLPGLRARAGRGRVPNQSGLLLGLLMVAHRGMQTSEHRRALVTGSALSAIGITLRPQRRR